MSTRLYLLLITLVLLLPLNAQTQLTWASPLSSPSMHPTFICQAQQGQTIWGTITMDKPYSYLALFYRPSDYYPNNPAYQQLQLFGSGNFSSPPLDTTGLWRVQIVPANSNQLFLFKLELSVNGALLGRFVDVARYKKLMVMHFEANQNCGFSVSDIPQGAENEIDIEFYQGSNSLDFSLQQSLFTNALIRNLTYNIECRSTQSSYYYLLLSASAAIMPLFPRILVNYRSDSYPCPMQAGFKDANKVFENCVQPSTQSFVYPCQSYDFVQSKCTACAEKFLLQEGNCYRSIDCGRGQYFSKGTCASVIANCVDYETIGGKCKFCQQGYQLLLTNKGQLCFKLPPNTSTTLQSNPSTPSNPPQTAPTPPNNPPQTIPPTQTNNPPTTTTNLQVTTTTSQVTTTSQTTSLTSKTTLSTDKTTPLTSTSNSTNTYSQSQNTVTPKTQVDCGPGYYFSRGGCIIIPFNCDQFNTSLQSCINCKPGYTMNLNSLDCVLAKIKCGQGYTNIGDQCIAFPANCVETNSFGNCTSCSINFVVNENGCKLKACTDRQYLSNSQCLPVSPLCDTFDPYQGYCLTCKMSYILSIRGTCEPPYYPPQAYNGCGVRQYLSGSSCLNVDSSCGLFDGYSGACITCVDSTDFLDRSNGVCLKATDVCQNRYYFSSLTRTCQEVSSFCETYDKNTGYCLTCKQGLTLFRGSCLYLTPCARNEYRSQEGLCLKADPSCDQADQSTGTCKSCIPGYELNTGGICCYSQNYLLTAKCKAVLSENCLQQRPVILNCERCVSGYSLINGVFGKCRKVY